MKKTFLACVSLSFSTLAVVAGVNVARGQKPAAPLLLVANQTSSDLSLIDVAAGKQVTTIPVEGVTGHEVAASPDGKTAYVPIYGDSGVGQPGTDGSSLAVIDIAARNPNVYLETSGMPMHTKIREAYERVGETRVLFGFSARRVTLTAWASQSCQPANFAVA